MRAARFGTMRNCFGGLTMPDPWAVNTFLVLAGAALMLMSVTLFFWR